MAIKNTKTTDISDFPEKTFIGDIAGQKMKIQTDGPESPENQLAVITHYFQNQHTPTEKAYKKDAITEVKQLLQSIYPEINITHQVAEDARQYGLFQDIFDIPYPTPEKTKFTFIDLFAGMGGFRIAMQKQGGKCIYSSEWNKFAQKTYFANFGEIPFGDITKEETKKYIPDNFDILCAGFPCQPFSIAGVSKKNSLGRATGFLDKTQGTLFFDVADIIKRKRPKAFLLEFPGSTEYHDILFPAEKLICLGAKTTCKDRWRQILNEADRIPVKHLFTLQQGISKNQLTEMYNNRVCLVVPAPYLKSFDKSFQDKIMTLNSFTTFVKIRQN